MFPLWHQPIGSGCSTRKPRQVYLCTWRSFTFLKTIATAFLRFLWPKLLFFPSVIFYGTTLFAVLCVGPSVSLLMVFQTEYSSPLWSDSDTVKQIWHISSSQMTPGSFCSLGSCWLLKQGHTELCGLKPLRIIIQTAAKLYLSHAGFRTQFQSSRLFSSFSGYIKICSQKFWNSSLQGVKPNFLLLSTDWTYWLISNK